MDVPVPYEVVVQRHHDEWKAIVIKVRKGKSKDKHTDPATWDWSYSWGTRIGLPDDYDGSLVPFPKLVVKLTLDERVGDEVFRSKPVHLVGQPPSHRTRAYQTLAPDYFPPEAEKAIRNGHIARMKEEKRQAALTPEESAAEIEAALDYLMGPRNKGFMALRVSPEIEGTVDSETWSATTNPREWK